METKIREAKNFLRSLKLLPERPIIVNFSGGKDSTTVLLLALEVLDDVDAYFMDSSITLPGVVDFVRDSCLELGVELHITNPVKHYYGDFFTMIRRKGYFPVISDAWCKKDLKLRPQRAYLRTIYGKAHIYKITGVRRQESTRRMRIYAGKRYIEPDGEHSGSYLVHPILNWTNKDVACFLEQRRIKINPLYRQVGVSDCKWCPFYQEEIYKKIAKLHPGIYDSMIELETWVGKPCVTGRKWLADVVKDLSPSCMHAIGEKR